MNNRVHKKNIRRSQNRQSNIHITRYHDIYNDIIRWKNHLNFRLVTDIGKSSILFISILTIVYLFEAYWLYWTLHQLLLSQFQNRKQINLSLNKRIKQAKKQTKKESMNKWINWLTMFYEETYRLCQVMCRKHGGIDKKVLVGKKKLFCCTYYEDVSDLFKVIISFVFIWWFVTSVKYKYWGS